LYRVIGVPLDRTERITLPMHRQGFVLVSSVVPLSPF
jgi:hypothetical protein